MLFTRKLHITWISICFKEATSLFGCNKGWIPYLLSKSLKTKNSEPLPWHLQIAGGLEHDGYLHHTLVIDLKPKGSKLSLYEVIDVWGYSANGWTPILLYLRGLFVDDEGPFNKKKFFRSKNQIQDPVFSMMYLRGTVQAGHLHDRWTPPGPSSTNSVLLWPDTLKYFTDEAFKIMNRP